MKKFLSVLLSIAMLVTLLPAMSVFALAEGEGFSGTPTVFAIEVLNSAGEAVDKVNSGDEITVNLKYVSGFNYFDTWDFDLGYNSKYFTASEATDTYGSTITLKTEEAVALYVHQGSTIYELAAGAVIGSLKLTVKDVEETNVSYSFVVTPDDFNCTAEENIPGLDFDNYMYESIIIPKSVNSDPITINPVKSSDATLKSLAAGTAIDLVAGTYAYEVEVEDLTTLPAVTYEVNDSKANATVATAGNVTTVTVIAEDGTELVYTVTFTEKAVAGGKITNLTSYIKGDSIRAENGGYQTEEEAVKTIGSVVIGENLTAKALRHYNNSEKVYAPSDDMLGASYIRTLRYYGGLVDHATHNTTETPIIKTIYNEDGTTETSKGVQLESYTKASGFRTFNVADHEYFKGNKDWMSFVVSADCTVVIGDWSGWSPSYPNINPEITPEAGWKKSDGKTNKIAGTSYWKSFKAGDTVVIPNYGMPTDLADTRKVTYEYLDANGKTQVYETDVAHTKIKWEGVSIAVKWEYTESSDATLKTLKVGNSEVALAADTYTYDFELPYGSAIPEITAIPNDANATAEVAVEGNVATITVTAEDESTQEYVVNITVASIPFANVTGINSSNIYKAFGTDSVEGVKVVAQSFTGYNTAEAAKAAANAVFERFNAVNGENAHLGTNGWNNYPQAKSAEAGDGSYTGSIDQPNGYSKEFIESLGKDVWTLKLGKGHYFKNYPLTEADDLGFHGDIEEYITFETTKPGTVYVKLFKTIVVGGDWEKVDNNLYAIHFDAGKVAIPGLHSTPESVTTAMNGENDKRIQNGPMLLFAFDDLSDATLEEITYTAGDASYTAAVEGDEIAIEVLPTVAGVKVTGAKGKLAGTTIAPVEIATGESGTLVATAPDGVGTKTYTVTVTALDEYKIISVTSKGSKWIDGIYKTKEEAVNKLAEKKNFGSYLVAIGGINSADAGTIAAHSDRADQEKLSLSGNFSDATVILTPRNGAAPTTKDITAYRYDETTETWVSDAQASFTRQVEGEEAQTITNKKYNAYGGKGATGFRQITAASLDKPLYAGDYADWITFVPTSDCTVILGDKLDLGWPKLDKTLWKSGTAYTYLGKNANTYTRHFKAGEVVSIPNYGIPEGLNDTRNVTYTYFDETGAEKTITMPVYYEYQSWMNIGVAIVWDDKAIVSDAEIMVDGAAIKAAAGETYEYAIDADAEVEVTAAYDAAATATGLGKYKAGDTATVVITAGDGETTSTYTIIFRAKSSDASLKSVKAGDADVAFDATNSAAIELAYGAEIPAVTAEATDANATVADVVVENNVATIKVTAEDGSEVTYTITFTFAEPSHDASLKAAKAGDADVTFDATNSATIELPYGSEIPAVTAEANDANAKVNVDVVENVATITITAQDGETSSKYTVTFTFADKLYALSVVAVKGTVLATYGDKVDEDWDVIWTTNVATGTEFTLTAVANEGATFLYWKDNNSGRIVSYNETYKVTVGTDKNLVAIFTTAEDGYTVEFVDRNYMVYVSASSNGDITVPADPYMLGYKFDGWEINGVKQEDYVAGYVIAAGTFTEATKVKAIQTLEETTYKVDLIGANEEGGEYQYNKAIYVTPAAVEGKVFSHWTRDGKIASYNEKYMFYVTNSDTVVEAVFVDDAETVKVMPTITMAEPTIVATNKISFIMERTVPEGYSVVESGILIQQGIVEEEGVITLDSYMYKGISANLGSYGAYTVRKGNVEVGESWSAVGYLIYSDGTDVYTIYTAPVSKTRD